MIRRSKFIVKQLAEYFAEKGRILSLREYKEAEDAPVRLAIAKRLVGSWSRLPEMIRKNFPELHEKLMEGPDRVKISAPEPKVAPKPAPTPTRTVAKPSPKPVSKDEE